MNSDQASLKARVALKNHLQSKGDMIGPGFLVKFSNGELTHTITGIPE